MDNLYDDPPKFIIKLLLPLVQNCSLLVLYNIVPNVSGLILGLNSETFEVLKHGYGLRDDTGVDMAIIL